MPAKCWGSRLKIFVIGKILNQMRWLFMLAIFTIIGGHVPEKHASCWPSSHSKDIQRGISRLDSRQWLIYYINVCTRVEIPYSPHAYNESLQDQFYRNAGRAHIWGCWAFIKVAHSPTSQSLVKVLIAYFLIARCSLSFGSTCFIINRNRHSISIIMSWNCSSEHAQLSTVHQVVSIRCSTQVTSDVTSNNLCSSHIESKNLLCYSHANIALSKTHFFIMTSTQLAHWIASIIFLYLKFMRCCFRKR